MGGWVWFSLFVVYSKVFIVLTMDGHIGSILPTLTLNFSSQSLTQTSTPTHACLGIAFNSCNSQSRILRHTKERKGQKVTTHTMQYSLPAIKTEQRLPKETEH